MENRLYGSTITQLKHYAALLDIVPTSDVGRYHLASTIRYHLLQMTSGQLMWHMIDLYGRDPNYPGELVDILTCAQLDEMNLAYYRTYIRCANRLLIVAHLFHLKLSRVPSGMAMDIIVNYILSRGRAYYCHFLSEPWQTLSSLEIFQRATSVGQFIAELLGELDGRPLWADVRLRTSAPVPSIYHYGVLEYVHDMVVLRQKGPSWAFSLMLKMRRYLMQPVADT